MFRVFSGSCLSLEDMDTVRLPNLVEHPHILGPGTDYFDQNGEPVRPQPEAKTLQKVFSGSALDLNAMNGEAPSDEDLNSPIGHPRGLPVSSILNQLSTETEKERTRMAKGKTHVLVIGDSSYVSSHVVAKLLEAGYTVRVTLQDAFNQQQQLNLYSMNRDTAQRLTIIETDMTNSSALRDAIRGCKYVIHCGCPTSRSKNPVAYHTQAVQALFDGIRLSGKSTVKRVVLTGAASSVFHITQPDTPSGVIDESCWNTVATAETDPVPYAKMVFEKEAWRLRQMLGVELVVLLPSIAIGPSRTEEAGEAMVTIQALASAPSYFPYAPNLYWNFVDIRDVAEAHVRALECQDAKDQRVIISNECLSLTELCLKIKKLYPHLTPPMRTANTWLTLLIAAVQPVRGVNLRFLWRSLGVRKCLSHKRAVEALGLQFTPMEDTVHSCVEQMIRAGELPTADSKPRWGGLKTTVVVMTGIAAVGTVAAALLKKKRAA